MMALEEGEGIEIQRLVLWVNALIGIGALETSSWHAVAYLISV
jgi:hypothetical protein